MDKFALLSFVCFLVWLVMFGGKNDQKFLNDRYSEINNRYEYIKGNKDMMFDTSERGYLYFKIKQTGHCFVSIREYNIEQTIKINCKEVENEKRRP